MSKVAIFSILLDTILCSEYSGVLGTSLSTLADLQIPHLSHRPCMNSPLVLTPLGLCICAEQSSLAVCEL